MAEINTKEIFNNLLNIYYENLNSLKGIERIVARMILEPLDYYWKFNDKTLQSRKKPLPTILIYDGYQTYQTVQVIDIKYTPEREEEEGFDPDEGCFVLTIVNKNRTNEITDRELPQGVLLTFLRKNVPSILFDYKFKNFNKETYNSL